MSEIAFLFLGLVVGFLVAVYIWTRKPEPEREILVKAVVSDFFGQANPADVLGHLEDAAWESRMDGGCHSKRSEVLTIWSHHLRDILPTSGA